MSNTSRRNIPEGFIITGFLVCPRLAYDIRPRLFQRTMAPLSGKPDHPCLLLNRRIQSASGHEKSLGHHYGRYKGAWPLLLSLDQAQGSPAQSISATICHVTPFTCRGRGTWACTGKRAAGSRVLSSEAARWHQNPEVIQVRNTPVHSGNAASLVSSEAHLPG